MKNKENNNCNNTGNNVGSGFLLGFIVGVLATLLLTTKKGREILKELLDKGIQKISDLEASFEKTKQKLEEEENDYVKPKIEEVNKELNNLVAENLRNVNNEKQIGEKNGRQKITKASREKDKSIPNTAIRRLFFRKSAKKSL